MGCNKYDRIASVQARFSGDTYDDEIFHLGRFCAEKCVFHHELKHFMYKTSESVSIECNKHSSLPADLDVGDKDERRRRRTNEAKRILKILKAQKVPFATAQWISLRDKLEMAKKKYLK